MRAQQGSGLRGDDSDSKSFESEGNDGASRTEERSEFEASDDERESDDSDDAGVAAVTQQEVERLDGEEASHQNHGQYKDACSIFTCFCS